MQIESSPAQDTSVLIHEVQHRCYNSLQLVGSLARYKSRATRNAETREALAYVAELASILGELHRQLDAPGETADFVAHLKRCQGHWQQLCNGHIEVSVEASEGIRMSGMQISNASLVVHELVMNAIKYAFPDGRRGKVTIRIELASDDQVTLTVSDNGVGACAPAHAKHTDGAVHGSSLIEFLVLSLGGTVETSDSGNAGHCVVAQWPL